MSPLGEYSASAVFDRIRKTLGARSDAELARMLGMSPQNLWNRKSRNAIPFKEAVYVALSTGASIDWLLLGLSSARGEMG